VLPELRLKTFGEFGHPDQTAKSGIPDSTPPSMCRPVRRPTSPRPPRPKLGNIDQDPRGSRRHRATVTRRSSHVPTSYWIDLDRAVVVSRAWDVLTEPEIREHHERIAADPAVAPDFRHLADVREVKRLAVTSDAAPSAAMIWRFLGGQHRAILTATVAQFEVARMFARYAELVGGMVEVFDSWGDAVMWLDAGRLEPAD
jgi:hypothetical protein